VVEQTLIQGNPQISKLQNRLLKGCYVPTTTAGLSSLLFLFLLRPFDSTIEANKAGGTVYYLDVYGVTSQPCKCKLLSQNVNESQERSLPECSALMRSTPLTSNIKLGGDQMLKLNPLNINDAEERFKILTFRLFFISENVYLVHILKKTGYSWDVLNTLPA
jgi:hypothetical protein